MPEWLKLSVSGSRAIIEFAIGPTQVISYSELEPAVHEVYSFFKDKSVDVVLITGRGPVWLYSAIVHTIAHLAKAVAVFDAIQKKHVIVVTHSAEFKIGQTLDV